MVDCATRDGFAAQRLCDRKCLPEDSESGFRCILRSRGSALAELAACAPPANRLPEVAGMGWDGALRRAEAGPRDVRPAVAEPMGGARTRRRVPLQGCRISAGWWPAWAGQAARSNAEGICRCCPSLQLH